MFPKFPKNNTYLRILHVDMDAFYASVEQRDHPQFRGKALVVGGDSDRGVVAAASYEARKFGIRSAMGIRKAKSLCPSLIIAPHRGQAYQEASDQLRSIMSQYTPLIEPISLDEAYLDIKGSEKLFGDAITIGKAIQNDVKTETNLNCSVGIAPNKFLAKIASDLNKPFGFCVISWDDRRQILDPLPIRTIGGIGRKTEATLSSLGIKTIQQLRNIPLETLKTCLGRQSEKFQLLANGQDNRPVTLPEKQISLGRERTFAKDLNQMTDVYRELQKLADHVASLLRKRKWKAHTLSVKIKFNDFNTITRQIGLEKGSNTTQEIYIHSKDLLTKVPNILKKGIRLIGISSSHFSNEGEGQLFLFEDSPQTNPNKKFQYLDQIIDEIRAKYGNKSISQACTIHTKKSQ